MTNRKEKTDKEREARERGRTIPLYTEKVAKEMTGPKKRGKVTPSKRG